MVSKKFARLSVAVVVVLIFYVTLKKTLSQGTITRHQRHLKDNAINHMEQNINLEKNFTTIQTKSLNKQSQLRRYTSNELIHELAELTQRFNSHKRRSCQPHEVVVFIKTHKTGSSTITNILNRYADLNDLKVALPMGTFFRFRWPVPFHWSSVDLWRLDGDTPSILCNHARYNRATMQLIMRKGAKYITILRNPVEQYESMFNYMEFNNYLQLNQSKNPLADFVENPVPVLFGMRDKFHGIPQTMNLVKNPMMFDLGLYPPAYDNETRVKHEIARIDEDFELVMIMEYFDESLILLKRALCWELEDILYLKFNERKHARKVQLNDHVKKKIRQWNKADVMLYEHFNKTLWEKIKNYGPSFWNELHEFRKLNSNLEKLCVDQTEFSEKGFQIQQEIRSFKLNPHVSNYDRYFCLKVIRNEISYIEYFRRKYKPFGSYQNILETEGKKKRSTRELIERLQIASNNIRFADDAIPRAIS